MENEDSLFNSNDDEAFVRFATEHIEKGAATKRGIGAREYIELVRQQWHSYSTDEVYCIKVLIDPLVQPELASEAPEEWTSSGLPYVVLIAAINSNGDLINAPSGYVPPSSPGIRLAHIAAGSPSGGIVPAPSQPTEYLIGFLDVLGFEALLNQIGLDELMRKYEELLTVALTPQSRPWNVALTLIQGNPMPGLMWLPVQTAYFSDSLLLWVHYHPGHVQEFLDRCSRVFCQSLALGIPIRGAISVGRALLDKNRGIYLGLPLIEAVRLESKSNWIGVALGASWQSEALRIPVPPDSVFIYQPPLKEGAESLFSGLVLDWPRIWRETRQDSAVDHLKALCHSDLPDELKARYTSAIRFYDYSQDNQWWFVPEGWTATRLKA
jgi:hypothetical protein